MQGGFLANLGKVYGIYTGTFVGFTIFIGLLEAFGVPNRILGYLFIFLTLGVYALIGYLARTSEVQRVLRRRPHRASLLQRHGDRRRLDERRVVHRHGGFALFRRL